MRMTMPSPSRPRGPARNTGALAALMLAAVAATAWSLPAAAAEAGVTLTDGYIRTIIPTRPAAGYFTLTNDGAADRTLVAASSPGCGSVMLHKSVSENGVEKMLPVASVAVPAHKSISFAPGGYHLMCMKPDTSVKPGGSVSMTLMFKDGGTVNAAFPVRGVGAN